VERELLPNAALKPLYEKLVWVYVYNDFTKSEADLAAYRIRLRFGISSWPNLILVDPHTLGVVGDTGRSVEPFLAAVDRVALKKPDVKSTKASTTRLADADKKAAALQAKPTVEDARKALADEDIVVKTVAVEYLAAESPEALLADAPKLLAVSNDQFRSAVCEAISKLPEKATITPELRKAVEAHAAEPKDSRNPNVQRINAMGALARIGNKESLEVMRKFAQEGAVNNGLTGATIRAIGAIGARDKAAKPLAIEILVNSFPPATGDDPKQAEFHTRMATGIAEAVHKQLTALTELKVDLPAKYTEETRKKLVEGFSKAVEKPKEEKGKGKSKPAKD